MICHACLEIDGFSDSFSVALAAYASWPMKRSRWADQELDFVGFSWIYSCFVPLLTLFLLSHLRIRTRIAWSFLMPGTLFKQEGADSKGWHERVPCFWQQTLTFRKAKTCKIRAGLVTHLGTHTHQGDRCDLYLHCKTSLQRPSTQKRRLLVIGASTAVYRGCIED